MTILKLAFLEYKLAIVHVCGLLIYVFFLLVFLCAGNKARYVKMNYSILLQSSKLYAICACSTRSIQHLLRPHFTFKTNNALALNLDETIEHSWEN